MGWLFSPPPEQDTVGNWRIRIIISVVLLMFGLLVMKSVVWLGGIIGLLALPVFLWALVRMWYARIRGIQLPDREDLRERYLREDPDYDN